MPAAQSSRISCDTKGVPWNEDPTKTAVPRSEWKRKESIKMSSPRVMLSGDSHWTERWTVEKKKKKKQRGQQCLFSVGFGVLVLGVGVLFYYLVHPLWSQCSLTKIKGGGSARDKHIKLHASFGFYRVGFSGPEPRGGTKGPDERPQQRSGLNHTHLRW